jgi:serine/threonine protein kinase/tetratricopeptide (TPR) repeat protein
MDERYQRAKKLFLEVCDLSPDERAAVLDRECGDDAELRADVESLIAHHDAPTAEISDADTRIAQGEESPRPRRIGPYRVIRELNRGGMGVIYLGVREDDQFRRRVAIKVLKRGMDTAEILRRFELERQLLAALNHPNIARLYDGGETDDGLPYFAMEYVEGQPIHDYCDTHRLRIAERLELFRAVCAAVHYAHQNLVVHRDLKPSNIIVTADGVPKLLDFGIAKLINPEMAFIAGDPTAPELRIMTPEYASPEQVRGDPITTASDIYSLGVLLYELVTGHRPYRLPSRVREEIQHVICDVDPDRPSTAVSRVEEIGPEEGASPGLTTTITPETVSRVREGRPDRLRRRLAGDIDNIVLMAMRKEPQRRYTSAEQFGDDIRRHLEGMPVIARRDTVGYRSLKFVRRHRVGVGAAATIAVLLVGGIVGTASGWQAERQQLKQTEKMFNQVRALARTFMFDFHDEIDELDGSLPARELLVTTALKYLDGLRAEARDDRDLQRDLAAGYERVGDICYTPRNPSLGRPAEAMENYQTARRIREELLEDEPDDLERQHELSRCFLRIGDVLMSTGRVGEALMVYREALTLSEKLAVADSKYQRSVAHDLNDVGAALLKQGLLDETRQYYSRVLKIRRQLAGEKPEDAMLQRDLSVAHIRMGGVLQKEGSCEASLEQFREALEIRQRIFGMDPDSGRAKRDCAIAHYCVGDVLLDLGRADEAMSHISECMPIFEERAESNRDSLRAQRDVVMGYEVMGTVQLAMDDPDAALGSFRRTHTISMALAAKHPEDSRVRVLLGQSYEGLADHATATGNRAAAIESYREALGVFDRLAAKDPDDFEHRVNRARLLLRLGSALAESQVSSEAQVRLEAARDLYEALLEAQPQRAEVRLGLASTLHELSKLLFGLGEPNGAIEVAEEAIELLDQSIPRAAGEALRQQLAEDLERYRRT